MAVEPLADQCFTEGPRALWGDKAFAIERRRHLCRRGSSGAQGAHTAQERLKVAELCVGAHGAQDLVLAARAPCPRDGALYIFAVALDKDVNVFHQAADHGLPIAIGGGRGLPHGGDSRRCGRDLSPLLRLDVRGRVSEQACLRLLELLGVMQRRLPPLRQRGRDHTVRRVDGLIPPFRQVHLVLGPLPLLLPMLPQPRPFVLNIVPCLEAQLSGRWLQGPQALGGHTGVEDGCLDPIAGLWRGRDSMPDTTRIGLVGPPRGDLHPTTTRATDEEARQQRYACAWRPHRVGAGLMLLEPLLVPQVVIPRDRGREMVLKQPRPLLQGPPLPVVGSVAGRGPLRINRAPAVGIGASIDGMVEPLGEGRQGGAPPLELAFLRPWASPYGQPDRVAHQGVKQPRERAQAGQLVAEPLDHGPGLCIGILVYVARRQEHIPHRDAMEHRTALGFVEASTLQALPPGMEFDFAHSPFEA